MSNVTSLVLVSIGNTRTRIAVARGPGGEFGVGSGTIEPSVVVENSVTGAGGLEEAVHDAISTVEANRSHILVASVNDAVVSRVAASTGGLAMTRLGNGSNGTVRVPAAMDVEQAATVGVDRLLCALAAGNRSGGSPCAVIDAGTCITVDFVDAFGVFQGGAIAPGVALMLRSMHTGTSALPDIPPPRKGDDTSWMNDDTVKGSLGKNTKQAMLLGTLNAVRGLVRWQVEKFAEAAGAYPRVIATGGDAPLLFDPRVGGVGDDLVEHIVPDLQLVGMVAAWALLQGGEGEESGEVAADDADDAD